MRTRLVWFLTPILLSCGSDPTDANGDGVADGVVEPNNVTVITPTKPLGYVAGDIRDAGSGRPISGATVAIFGGGISGETTTEGAGSFEIGPIAAGATFSIQITAGGYVDALMPGLTIDDEAGNFPTVNGALYVGPVQLLTSDGEYTVQVVAEDGQPVMGAEVTVETSARFFAAGLPRDTGFASGTTDQDGRVTVTGLPNVWSLPPSHEAHAALVINVAPVDSDGDGAADLSGTTMAVSGRDARNEALAPVIVLRRGGAQPLQVVASNVPGLAGAPPTQPSIIAPGEDIRIVFNKPVDRESILVDLVDETGSTPIATAAVTGAFDNLLFVDPAEDLEPGTEYNLAIRVHSLDSVPTEVLSLGSPVFAQDDPQTPIAVIGSYVDNDGDGLFGSGNDAIELRLSRPVGRPGASPAFRVELLVALDLNGTSTIGDAPGELAPPGAAQPPPLLLDAAEPSPGNGAGLSGFTTMVAPRVTLLPMPLSRAGTSVDMEVRFVAERNDGQLVTTASGRRAPEKFTGPLTLVTR